MTEKRKHNFLAEELLIPNVDKVDSSRINMFCSHINQAVVLDNPEPPKVFTGFENQIGYQNSSIEISDKDYEIISQIKKNKNISFTILKAIDSNEYICHMNSPVNNITESYGYKSHNHIKDLKVGGILPEDSIITRSSSVSEVGNLQYGLNLKSMFMSYKGLTYEDGIVISKSASEKMGTQYVHEVEVMINNNDIFVNLYGDKNNYKGFPNIGEEIKDKILCSRRRIDYESFFSDLNKESMMGINIDSDQVFYVSGEIIDIKVFSNKSISELNKHPSNEQILKHLKNDNLFYTKCLEEMKAITSEDEDNTNIYSSDFGYYLGYFEKALSEKTIFTYNDSDYDNLLIKFTILEKKPLYVSSKITNRYGGKGIISKIVEDKDMPTTEDGQVAELILNPLGVFNRNNIAQLYEQELNFISNELILKYKNDKEKMLSEIKEFLKIVSTEQFQFYEDNNLWNEEFIDNMIKDGLSIHQKPFFDNVTFYNMIDLYKKFGIRPKKFIGIETPFVLGEMYFMR